MNFRLELEQARRNVTYALGRVRLVENRVILSRSDASFLVKVLERLQVALDNLTQEPEEEQNEVRSKNTAC